MAALEFCGAFATADATRSSGQTDVVPAHYRAPGWFTRNVANRAVAFLTRHGVSIVGSRVLAAGGGPAASGATPRCTWQTTTAAAIWCLPGAKASGCAICGPLG